tara:strand:+ start:127 stop:4623 length:4497 start_codon:yes stop_codon:yes gene_type:complete
MPVWDEAKEEGAVQMNDDMFVDKARDVCHVWVAVWAAYCNFRISYRAQEGHQALSHDFDLWKRNVLMYYERTFLLGSNDHLENILQMVHVVTQINKTSKETFEQDLTDEKHFNDFRKATLSGNCDIQLLLKTVLKIIMQVGNNDIDTIPFVLNPFKLLTSLIASKGDHALDKAKKGANSEEMTNIAFTFASEVCITFRVDADVVLKDFTDADGVAMYASMVEWGKNKRSRSNPQSILYMPSVYKNVTSHLIYHGPKFSVSHMSETPFGVHLFLTPRTQGGRGPLAAMEKRDDDWWAYTSRCVQIPRDDRPDSALQTALLSLNDPSGGADETQNIKMQLLALKKLMCYAFGMYAASIICETTILSCDYMRSLMSHDTNSGDLPVKVKVANNGTSGLRVSKDSDFDDKHLSLSYRFDEEEEHLQLYKDGIILDEAGSRLQLLYAHRRDVITNFFIMKEGRRVDKRNLVLRHFFSNFQHFDGDCIDDGLRSDSYVRNLKQMMGGKMDVYPTELALLGESPCDSVGTFVDTVLLYSPTLETFCQEREALIDMMNRDEFRKEYQTVRGLLRFGKASPSLHKDSFSKTLPRNGNYYFPMGTDGYPQWKFGEEEHLEGRLESYKKLCSMYTTAINKQFDDDLHITNIAEVMEHFQAIVDPPPKGLAGDYRDPFYRATPLLSPAAAAAVDAGAGASAVVDKEAAAFKYMTTHGKAGSYIYQPHYPGSVAVAYATDLTSLRKRQWLLNHQMRGLRPPVFLERLPVMDDKLDPAETDKEHTTQGLVYNASLQRPQMFAMLDASALLWNARKFHNPSDCLRGIGPPPEKGSVDDMHYWCRTLVESFIFARQRHREHNRSNNYEDRVKYHPGDTFPSRLIGSLTDESFKKMFPLLPLNSAIRDSLRRVRSLNVIWGDIPGNLAKEGERGHGAWMPLSQYHRAELFKNTGLFDEKYNVPSNPWCAHNGNGISRVFNQSYHSVYHTDSFRAPHFQDWIKRACQYQQPVEKHFAPFSQYGGTPVQADFIHHRVEFPDDGIAPSLLKRHKQLVYNRFGMTLPLRLGQQFHDRGYLQDMYQQRYRSYADLSQSQREMPVADEVWMSNFMTYARTHSIIALASCNHGTEEGSVPRIVRNLYRLYVDSYDCMGASPDDDTVPCIMGFLPTAVNGRDDRPVTLYAGSLTCLNTKLERFCNSDANRGERVCQSYKQAYLNDAAILYNRLSRNKQREMLHDTNYSRARDSGKRGKNYTRPQFDRELIQLQDTYIEFLQQTCIGMLLESGANLGNMPLQLLEPRRLEIGIYSEDTDMVNNDYDTPRTSELLKEMDFTGDNLNRTQLAILSLIPPNHRILSTLKFNQDTAIIDLEHAKKRIQQETIASNKKLWKRYTDALISGAFAAKLLEVDGPIDPGFDMSAVKDPLKESEKIKDTFTTSHSEVASSLSQSMRSDRLRRDGGPDSVLGINTAEMEKALQAVRGRVERDFERNGREMSRIQCLAHLRVPDHVKRMLIPEYR